MTFGDGFRLAGSAREKIGQERLPPCARLTPLGYRVSCFACALLGERHLLAQLLLHFRSRCSVDSAEFPGKYAKMTTTKHWKML
jgi:hypothetical protein